MTQAYPHISEMISDPGPRKPYAGHTLPLPSMRDRALQPRRVEPTLWAEETLENSDHGSEPAFAAKVREITGGMARMLMEKNAAYGNAALDPVRVFSQATPEEQILVRIDDKLSRIQRGHEFADEDTVNDLIGYLILLKIARA